MTAATTDGVDVVVVAPVYFDMILTDLDDVPRPGTEVQAGTLAASPGGSATLAVAASRLGLRTTLAAALGDDVYGRWCWEFLANEARIDLGPSRRLTGWQTPVTVSIAADGDRTMITRADASLVSADDLLDGRDVVCAALAELSGMGRGEVWSQRAVAAGARIFADTGWDSTGHWDQADLGPLASCFAFTPNASEAMAYTRTDTPGAAARALADHVPLVVVTCGADGAIAIDASNGVEVVAPAVPVHSRDATGAGDVFRAALVFGTLRDWPLDQRLAFAALCAALTAERPGGALAAPGWGDLADWWSRTVRASERDLVARYGFLADVLPSAPTGHRSDSVLDFAGHDTESGTGADPKPQKGPS